MATKSTKAKTKAKSPYQEMLQRGIGEYMEEKQPDSHNKAKRSDKTETPTQTPRTNKDEGTPPASNVRDKAANEQPLPESDEETEEERLKRTEEERIEDEEARKMVQEMRTDEEKKTHEEDDKIMEEIEQSAEEQRLADANKDMQVDPLNLMDDLNNEHGPQSKINEKLKPKTPKERMKAVRDRAKKKERKFWMHIVITQQKKQ